MATEIEHKYLVINDSFRDLACRQHEITQGFLSRDPERTVRVRVLDDEAFITIKGKGDGAMHPEYEYSIPMDDALEMMAMCEPPIIEKTRYIIMHQGNRWEVDEFHGDHEGLILAELEVPSVEYRFHLPNFIGREVTGEPQYYNSALGIRKKDRE